MKRFKARDCEGQVLVIVAIVLLVLVIAVGLAIDSGRAYGVKAKLSAAADAAAIAAALAIGQGVSEAEDAAEKYFYANYPADYFGGTREISPPSISYSDEGDAQVDISSKALVPMTFMRIIGFEEVEVVASAQATRRAADIAFVVDNSSSLVTQGNVYQDVQTRSKEFVEALGENFDRLALIKYAHGAEVPVPFTSDRGFDEALIKTEIDDMDFGYNCCDGSTASHYTNQADGFWNALNQLKTVPSPSKLQVIVFFTDGAPNTWASTFDIKGESDGVPGAIRSGPSNSGTPRGLFTHYVAPYDPNASGTYGNMYDVLARLPKYYNPCDAYYVEDGKCADPHSSDFGSPPPSGADCGCWAETGSEGATNEAELRIFKILYPDARRGIGTNSGFANRNDLWRKVHRISRNLPEDMALAARQNGIFVYTLGLGDRLTEGTGPDNEKGEDMLIRMANDPNYEFYNDEETQGLYCHASTADDLLACYAQIIEAIIRLTI